MARFVRWIIAMVHSLLPKGRKTAIEIYLGDCLIGMPKIPDKSVDVVVTSPPYNLGIKYKSYKDDQQREAHLAWCEQWAREVHRVLRDDGSFFLNLGASPSNPYLPHEIAVNFKDFFTLQNDLHWIKAISIETDDGEVISKGHFKPISSPRFVNDCHEYLFHFTKTGCVEIDRKAMGVPYADKSNINRWGHTGGEDRRCRGNNWFMPYKTIRDRALQRPHPASFPPSLAENCIKLHGVRPDLVMLDPFLGIGNSAIAAKHLGIGRFIGFDIEEDYLKIAAEKTGAKIKAIPEGAI